jgi:hypothetical protein
MYSFIVAAPTAHGSVAYSVVLRPRSEASAKEWIAIHDA